MRRDLVCAVDVGTGSARAAIIAPDGHFLGQHDHPIAMRREGGQVAEHDSEDIWRAVAAAVRGARRAADVDASRIAGIGFDATCSLVMRDAAGAQLSVSSTDEPRWDTIVWLDHRAIAEADACTRTGHPVLEQVSGRMSPEMVIPKAMWLKHHKPQSWARMGHLFDLADFLTWKASGSTARSQCTLACKWTYSPQHQPHWRADFLDAAGLPDFVRKAGLPGQATPPGSDLGTLTPAAAEALGLDTGCRVSTGLIDAYAGMLGLLGRFASDEDAMRSHLALIAGTSSCLMTLSAEPVAFPGGWGPYLGVGLPGLWTSEGGQSATGALLDHVIRVHGAAGSPSAETHRQIAARIAELRAAGGPDLAPRLHVLPDYHGNRTPLADPHALGVVSGLDLDSSFDGLCRLYWRTAVAIALGTRQILEALGPAGKAVTTLHIAGGHSRTTLMPELYADATGRAIAIHPHESAMLTGGAICAAVAAGLHPDLPSAARAMSRDGQVIQPNPAACKRFERDYAVLLAMQEHRRSIETLISTG